MRDDFNDTLRQEGPEGVRRRLDAARKFEGGKGNGGGSGNGGQTSASQEQQDPNTLPFTWSEELQPVLDVADFVERVLTEACLAVVYGDSGVGKTFWAIDLGLHIAAGLTWNGRETDKGIVIYVALEGGKLTHNRVIKAREELKLPPDTPFILVTCPLDLRTADTDAIRLTNTIKKAVADARGRGLPVRLVIIDTLSRALNGGAENAEDMGCLLKHADLVRRETDVAILFVAHCGKDAAKGIRGWSGIRAAIDVEIEITRTGEGEYPYTAHVTKERDLPDGDRFSFALKTREVGLNQRGKMVTTKVVAHADGANKAEPPGKTDKKKQKEKPLTERHIDFREQIYEIMADLAEPIVPMAGMPAVRGVKRDQCRSELVRRGWFPESQLSKEGEVLRSGLTAEWNALRALKRRRVLSYNRVYVWLV